MRRLCVALIPMIAGCATVLKTEHEHATGVTPTRITIPRAAQGTVNLERGLNGAYWSNFALLPSLNLAYFMDNPQSQEDRIFRAVNLAVGLAGLSGFVVDQQNGRGFRHFPDEITEKLEPVH